MAFSGTVQECIAHMVHSVGRQEAANIMAKFTKSTVHPTAERWAQGSTVPNGNFYARLMYLLKLLGYDVTEYRQSTRHGRMLIRLVALEIFTPEDLQVQLQYKNAQSLWQVAFGRQNATTERKYRIEQLTGLYSDDIKNASSRWEVEYQPINERCQLTSEVAVQEISEPEAKVNYRTLARLLANLIQSVGLVLDETDDSVDFNIEVDAKFTSVSPRHVTVVTEFLMKRLPAR